MPYAREILEGFGSDLTLASLSIMNPGTDVRWHRDNEQSADLHWMRLHLPIRTATDA